MTPPDPFRGTREPHRVAYDPPPADPDDDGGSVLDYYRRRVAATELQLDERNAPTDPELLAKLRRELEAWRVLIASEEQRGHFDGGAGDRPLF